MRGFGLFSWLVGEAAGSDRLPDQVPPFPTTDLLPLPAGKPERKMWVSCGTAEQGVLAKPLRDQLAVPLVEFDADGLAAFILGGPEGGA